MLSWHVLVLSLCVFMMLQCVLMVSQWWLFSAAVNHRFPKPMRNISISLDAVDEWHMRCVVELVMCLTGLSERVGRHADGLDRVYDVSRRYCDGTILILFF